MEYAKDEVFQVGYRTNLKRLELKEESLIKRLYRGAKRHKLFTAVMIAFFMFSTIYVVMWHGFMKILQNI